MKLQQAENPKAESKEVKLEHAETVVTREHNLMIMLNQFLWKSIERIGIFHYVYRTIKRSRSTILG